MPFTVLEDWSLSLVSGLAEWENPPPPPSLLGGLLLLAGSGASLDEDDLWDRYRLVLVLRRESLLTILTHCVLLWRPERGQLSLSSTSVMFNVQYVGEMRK